LTARLDGEETGLPVQTYCPHCQSRCLVAEQHFGLAVLCFQCKRPFTVAAPAADLAPLLGERQGRGECLLEIGSATSPGRVRARNEDGFLVQQWRWAGQDRVHELALIVIADGMGGHQAGERASGLTVRTVAQTLAPFLAGIWDGVHQSWTSSQLGDALGRALREANQAIYEEARRDQECEGMGATAVALLIWKNQALIRHVGDTRVYHRRGTQFTQVSRDQTLVARMIELGQLAPEEAPTHPARHEVLQALGRREDLVPATYIQPLAPHDWLVIASDGLHAHLGGPALMAALDQEGLSAAMVARFLVERADRSGGSDNCTVVTVRCLEG
jgi:protein phosphatase